MDVKYTKDGKRVKVTKTELRQFDAPMNTLASLHDAGDKSAEEAWYLLKGIVEKYSKPVIVKPAEKKEEQEAA